MKRKTLHSQSTSMLDIYEYITSHGVEVIRDEGSELACLCPFHKNTDSPAFYINKHTGLWICFNPSCEKRGSIRDLMTFFGDQRPMVKDHSIADIEANLSTFQQDCIVEDWDGILDSIKIKFPEDSGKVQYLLDRGISEKTLSYFEVGFSPKKNRIVIPTRDDASKLVGFIGRAVKADVQPKYLYSKGFPRKSVLFNLNRAKKFDSVIIVEGSVDAMKIHQAGFSNVVATLGAAVTEEHISLIRRNFDDVIIFADNDDAGLSMKDKLVKGLSDKAVRVVEYLSDEIKDPGDMDAESISECIAGAQDWLFSSLAWCEDDGAMV
jgi:DNA primase